MQRVGPDLSDSVDRCQTLNVGVAERVGSGVRRVGACADSGNIVGDIGAKGKVSEDGLGLEPANERRGEQGEYRLV